MMELVGGTVRTVSTFFNIYAACLLQLVTPRAGGVECTSAASTERWTVASGRS